MDTKNTTTRMTRYAQPRKEMGMPTQSMHMLSRKTMQRKQVLEKYSRKQ